MLVIGERIHRRLSCPAQKILASGYDSLSMHFSPLHFMSHLNFRITSGIRTVWFGLLWIDIALTSAKADPVLYAGYEDSENNFQQHFGTLDPITGSFTDIATEPVQLDGLGFAPDGIMYATDVNNVVYQVDPATGLSPHDQRIINSAAQALSPAQVQVLTTRQVETEQQNAIMKEYTQGGNVMFAP